MSKNYLCAGIVALALSILQQAAAGPLTSAEVTKIINRVAVIDPARGDHPAAIRDVIKDDLGLQTGEKSRSELLFQDNTLTRLGAETFFSFKTGTRDMTLEKGSMLLQVPKGLGGAKVHTAAVTAAITGTTIMMEYIPGRYIKVLVLEGSLRLSRNGRFGDSLVLRPGKMVIMRPDAKTIPEPVDVDIKRIVKTSTLVNFPDSPPLPSMSLIQDAIEVQDRSLAKGDLAPTNLVMGHGTDVIVATNDQLARIAAIEPANGSGNVTSNVSTSVVGSTPDGVSIADVPPISVLEPPTEATESLTPAAAGTTALPVTDSVTKTTSTVVTSVTESTTSLGGSVVTDTSATLGSVAKTTTSSVGSLATDTTALVGSVAGPVALLLETVTATTTSLLPPLTDSTALPLVASVADTTTSALPLANSVSNTTTSLLNSAPTSVTPVVDTVTGTVSALSIISAPTGVISTNTSSLPVLGSVLGSTSAIPAGGGATQVTTSVPSVASVLTSAPTATSPTLAVSNSTQLLNILSTTPTTTSGGTVVVGPTTVTAVAVAPTTTSTPAPISTTGGAITTSTATGTVTMPTSAAPNLITGTASTTITTAKPVLPIKIGL